jgi:hypothetical protein
VSCGWSPCSPLASEIMILSNNVGNNVVNSECPLHILLFPFSNLNKILQHFYYADLSAGIHSYHLLSLPVRSYINTIWSQACNFLNCCLSCLSHRCSVVYENIYWSLSLSHTHTHTPARARAHTHTHTHTHKTWGTQKLRFTATGIFLGVLCSSPGTLWKQS